MIEKGKKREKWEQEKSDVDNTKIYKKKKKKRKEKYTNLGPN